MYFTITASGTGNYGLSGVSINVIHFSKQLMDVHYSTLILYYLCKCTYQKIAWVTGLFWVDPKIDPENQPGQVTD